MGHRPKRGSRPGGGRGRVADVHFMRKPMEPMAPLSVGGGEIQPRGRAPGIGGQPPPMAPLNPRGVPSSHVLLVNLLIFRDWFAGDWLLYFHSLPCNNLTW